MKRLVIVSCAILVFFAPLLYSGGPLAEEGKSPPPAQPADTSQDKAGKTADTVSQECDVDEKALELLRRREVQEQALELRERRNVLAGSEKRLREDQRKLRNDMLNQRIDQQITRVEHEIQSLNRKILELEQKKLR
ncbi:MAG: hypothetical protein RDU20_22965, partial [Desulfomonilaceae bacterium]|nr:hypothetical protein [Desulfomonilaceae bacterium]